MNPDERFCGKCELSTDAVSDLDCSMCPACHHIGILQKSNDVDYWYELNDIFIYVLCKGCNPFLCMNFFAIMFF